MGGVLYMIETIKKFPIEDQGQKYIWNILKKYGTFILFDSTSNMTIILSRFLNDDIRIFTVIDLVMYFQHKHKHT